MHDGDEYESDVIRLNGRPETPHRAGAINSTRQVKLFCNWFKGPQELPTKTADTHSAWLRSFRINCVPPKIGLWSWKQNLPFIRREPSGLSSGSIGSTLRSRIDFFSRMMAVAR